MGIIYSKFKKKESTKAILKKIQDDLNNYQEYKEDTEQRRKKLVGQLVAYSMVLYFIAAVVCYFYYLPPTYQEKLLYATPFAAFPIVILLIKKLLTWHYQWRLHRNEKKLVNLRERRGQILEQVMDTETYKVAKEILETYAPETLRNNSMRTKSPTAPTPNNSKMPINPGSEVRRRIIPTPAPSLIRGGLTPVPPAYRTRAIGTPRPVAPGPTRIPEHSAQTGADMPLPFGPPMPRPVLPRERTVMDRFIDYLVGDGPANRYALVCRQCESHNGMALKDEFEYLAFRCVYCYYWNPSRKQRPQAPRLESFPVKSSMKLNLGKERKTVSSSEDSEQDGNNIETDSESGRSTSTEGSFEHHDFRSDFVASAQNDSNVGSDSQGPIEVLETESHKKEEKDVKKSSDETKEEEVVSEDIPSIESKLILRDHSLSEDYQASHDSDPHVSDFLPEMADSVTYSSSLHENEKIIDN